MDLTRTGETNEGNQGKQGEEVQSKKQERDLLNKAVGKNSDAVNDTVGKKTKNQ